MPTPALHMVLDGGGAAARAVWCASGGRLEPEARSTIDSNCKNNGDSSGSSEGSEGSEGTDGSDGSDGSDSSASSDKILRSLRARDRYDGISRVQMYEHRPHPGMAVKVMVFLLGGSAYTQQTGGDSVADADLCQVDILGVGCCVYYLFLSDARGAATAGASARSPALGLPSSR